MVKASLARRALAAVGLAVEMPFAGMAGAVSSLLQPLGDGHLAGPQEDAAVGRDPVADAEAIGDPAGHEPGARGGTDRG